MIKTIGHVIMLPFLCFLVANLGFGWSGEQSSYAGIKEEGSSRVSVGGSEHESNSSSKEDKDFKNSSSLLLEDEGEDLPDESNITNTTVQGQPLIQSDEESLNKTANRMGFSPQNNNLQGASEEGFTSNTSSLLLTKSCSSASNPCIGTDGDDDMTGDSRSNSMYGKKGNDLMNGRGAKDGIYGNEGDDTMDGGTEDDQMAGDEGNDNILGGEGDDSMHGNRGNDMMTGGTGNDGIGGDDGNDNLKGEVGNDFVTGDLGGDIIDGGEGNDRIYHGNFALKFEAISPDGSKDTIDCGNGQDEAWINLEVDGDTTINCEMVNGQALGGGHPPLSGKNELENKTQSNDTKTELNSSSITQNFAGNTVSCSASNNPCIGTDESDFMLGDGGMNSMEGRKGDDVMGGLDGIDNMHGNEGLDKMQGNRGDDTMDGGDDRDEMFGGEENDKMKGGAGDDYMIGDSGVDNMDGGPGKDSLLGGPGDDFILGYGEADILIGNAGSDSLFGFEGNDLLFHSSQYSAAPDGQIDLIYCGDGYDEVWLNRVADGDTAYNCEVVHEKDDPLNTDPDNDYVPTNIDNCATVSNNSQMDSDGDGLGDPCDPYPFTSKSRDSTVFVTFNSITIHHDREGAASGSGEWDLVAYVQGNRVKLTDATQSNIVCGATSNCFNLWYAAEEKTYQFDKGTSIKVIVPEKFPLSIFTVGSEVDGCGRDNYPEVIPNIISDYSAFDLKKISDIQTRLVKLCPNGTGLNNNDILGTINEAYNLVPGVQPKVAEAGNGDFTLRYTINVIPP